MCTNKEKLWNDNFLHFFFNTLQILSNSSTCYFLLDTLIPLWSFLKMVYYLSTSRPRIEQYSGDLNTRFIWIPNNSLLRFQMVSSNDLLLWGNYLGQIALVWCHDAWVVGGMSLLGALPGYGWCLGWWKGEGEWRENMLIFGKWILCGVVLR